MLFKWLLRRFKRHQTCLGIDIGSSSIKAVLLSKPDDEIQINTLIQKELPAGTLVNKSICNLPAFENAVKQIRAHIPRNIKNAHIALTGSQVSSKIIQVDKTLNLREIEQYLYGNLHLLTNEMTEKVNVDFSVIGENKIDSDLKDVFVIMAKQALINKRVSLLKQYGFNCVVVDVESHAIIRALQLEYVQIQSRNIAVFAVVHVGQTTSLLIVFAGNEVVFSRELTIGLALLKAADSHDLNNMEVERFFTQLHHSLKNYSSILGGKPIEYWFCSGGGVHVPKFVARLTQTLQADVNVCQPLNKLACVNNVSAQIKQQLIHNQGNFQVALGLAARGIS